MEINLSGRVALVTGASFGIGRASALALGRAGADVVVNHLHDERNARSVAREIDAAGARAMTVEADVSDEDEVQDLFDEAIRGFGTIHILVNNAGIQKDRGFTEMSLHEWQSVLDVNLTGQFLCAREAAREFCRRGPPQGSNAVGNILCMSSVHQRIPWAGHANYAASKGGVSMLMETLAQELAPFRIRVNAIAPGAIKTPINAQTWQSEEGRQHLLSMIPSGRIGEPDDVAQGGGLARFPRRAIMSLVTRWSLTVA